MKCGARVALGVAGGYLLGRTKKMKLALMLGGMAAGKKAGGPGQLLAQGTKLLGQSPELNRLTDEIRGRLLDAGKAAAVAVATRQVEALTERVVGRVGSLTDVGGKTVADVGDTVGDVGRSVGDVGRRVGGRSRAGRRRVRRRDVDVPTYEDEAVDEAGGRRGRGRRRGHGRRATTTTADDEARGRRHARRRGRRRGRGAPMRTPSTRRRKRLRSRRHRRCVDVPRRPRRMHGAAGDPAGTRAAARARPPSGPPDVAPVARRGHARGAAMPEQRDDKNGLADALPTDALKDAGQQLLGLLVQRATDAAAQRVSGLADRLTDVTTSGGDVRAAMPVAGGRATSAETTVRTTVSRTTSRVSSPGRGAASRTR